MRRNLHMTYIVENNGCYGLTKGQTPTMDTDSSTKSINPYMPIDLVRVGIGSVRPLLAAASRATRRSSYRSSKQQSATMVCPTRGFHLRDVQQPSGLDQGLASFRERNDAMPVDFTPEKPLLPAPTPARCTRSVCTTVQCCGFEGE